MLRPKKPISFLRDDIPFGYGTTILLDAKTCSVPQFIGAPKHNFETADLGIKLSVPLAPNTWVNPSETLVLAVESLHHPWPPRTEESQRCSKCIRGQSSKGRKLELVGAIDETLNTTKVHAKDYNNLS